MKNMIKDINWLVGRRANFPTKNRLLYETEDIGITNQWSCQCNYLGARTESMLQSYPTTVVPRVGNNRACDLSTRCNSLLNPQCPLNGTMLVHVNTIYIYSLVRHMPYRPYERKDQVIYPEQNLKQNMMIGFKTYFTYLCIKYVSTERNTFSFSSNNLHPGRMINLLM